MIVKTMMVIMMMMRMMTILIITITMWTMIMEVKTACHQRQMKFGCHVDHLPSSGNNNSRVESRFSSVARCDEVCILDTHYMYQERTKMAITTTQNIPSHQKFEEILKIKFFTEFPWISLKQNFK